MKKGIWIALIVLLLGVFCFSGWKLTGILREYRTGEKAYEELEQFVSIPAAKKEQSPASEKPQSQTGEAPSEPESAIGWPAVDFDALRKVNQDVVGWIYIPDTQVNYPIVQGKDNDRYLYRLIDGSSNSAGSIFLDADNLPDFSEKNSSIYGHNMKNGTMFADVTGYKSQEFYDAHPIALLVTPEKNYVVHLFSGYVTDAWADAWDTNFSPEQYQKWLDKRIQKSCFCAKTVPTTEDRVLTFSTCTYETQDGRFVVHGILEEYKTAAG